MLREKKDSFDVIISDVYMPDMDGFKLLELVGLEMDLPVIMMSANGETSAVMKGIKHGACDYLLKPVRMEELRNIWQHVVRKKWRAPSQHVVLEDEKGRHMSDDGEHNASANEGLDGSWKQAKKRRDCKEEEDETDIDGDDPNTTKKPRVVWSVELHQQFVNAVNQLGIDKAVPKRILELMNVQGLTRENVASHLQKYRLYLKRISGVPHQPGQLNPPFPLSNDLPFGPTSASGLGGLGSFRTLGRPNELPSQALLSSLQAGLLGRLNQVNNLGLGNMENSNLLHISALQGPGGGALVRPQFLSSYSQPVLNEQPVLPAGQGDVSSLQLAQLGALSGIPQDKLQVGLSALQKQPLESAVTIGGLGQLASVGCNIQQVNSDNNTLLLQALQQQQAGSHLSGKSNLTLAASGNTALQGLSTDAGVWATALSSLNGNVRADTTVWGQYGASSRLGSTSGVSSSSVSQGPLRRVPDQECKNQQGLSTDAGVWGASLTNLNAAGNSSRGIPSQDNGASDYHHADSAGSGPVERAYNTESEQLHLPKSANVPPLNHSAISSMNVPSSLPSLSQRHSHSIGSRFTGPNQVLYPSQRSQGTWQGVGLGGDYSLVSSCAVQSPSCSSRTSCNNHSFQQELGQLSQKRMTGNLIADEDCVKVFRSEHSSVDNSLKMENEDRVWIQGSPSDELLSAVLR
ncbi:hypothetical protein KP509_03G063700 [Ceratopteris richardii]|nr:hypothetical protein KP509_03G063700 [Ceratopteris richardii]